MGNNYFSDPLLFIISTVFDLYIFAFILRFLLQWVRADFYNPVSQFIAKITDPPLLPLRKIIPGLAGIDLAAVVLILLLASIKQTLMLLIKGYAISGLALAIVIFAFADTLQLVLNLFFFTILIQIILSWIAPHQHNPVNVLLHQLNEPLLRPARRLLPPISGIDLSPMLVILLLKVSEMLLLPPIYALAR